MKKLKFYDKGYVWGVPLIIAENRAKYYSEVAARHNIDHESAYVDEFEHIMSDLMKESSGSVITWTGMMLSVTLS